MNLTDEEREELLHNAYCCGEPYEGEELRRKKAIKIIVEDIIGPNADLTLLRQQGNREEYKKQYYINLEKDKIRGKL